VLNLGENLIAVLRRSHQLQHAQVLRSK